MRITGLFCMVAMSAKLENQCALNVRCGGGAFFRVKRCSVQAVYLRSLVAVPCGSPLSLTRYTSAPPVGISK